MKASASTDSKTKGLEDTLSRNTSLETTNPFEVNAGSDLIRCEMHMNDGNASLLESNEAGRDDLQFSVHLQPNRPNEMYMCFQLPDLDDSEVFAVVYFDRVSNTVKWKMLVEAAEYPNAMKVQKKLDELAKTANARGTKLCDLIKDDAYKSQSLLKHMAKVALDCKSRSREQDEEDEFDVSRILQDEQIHNSLLQSEHDDYSLNQTHMLTGSKPAGNQR